MRLNDKLPPSFQSVVEPTLEALSAQVVDRLWAKDHRLWKPDPKEIADRLGWLTVQDQMRQHLEQLQRCTAAAKGLNIKDIGGTLTVGSVRTVKIYGPLAEDLP